MVTEQAIFKVLLGSSQLGFATKRSSYRLHLRSPWPYDKALCDFSLAGGLARLEATVQLAPV